MELGTHDIKHAGGRCEYFFRFALVIVCVIAVTIVDWTTIAQAGESEDDNDPADYEVIYPPHPGEYSSPNYAGREIVVEVTAYNAGDPGQTDNTPCISASGDDICSALARGHKRCAANFVPFGTRIHIQNFGECLVVDRLNPRYPNRVDIAMHAGEKQRAINFGIKSLVIKILN